MQKLLTIVVPVYKVEPYINKCLDSLILKDEHLIERLEVIVVNDGTPDRSAEMSREYAKRYPKTFRQIDKENGGHGSVWNLGLKEAKGKYTRFLDSDDWLENLDLLIENLRKCDADLVITPTLCHCAGGELWKQEILDMQFGRVYDADSFDWLHNRSHRNYTLHHSCTYKTEKLRQYLPLFLEKQPYDDMILGAAPIIGAQTLVAFDFIVYHYLMDRDGQSISSSVQLKNVDAKIKVQKAVIDFVENHPLRRESSKYQYFKIMLPKMYNFGYKSFFSLPRQESKNRIREWDDWVKRRKFGLCTVWMLLYRCLPYDLYRKIGLFSAR